MILADESPLGPVWCRASGLTGCGPVGTGATGWGLPASRRTTPQPETTPVSADRSRTPYPTQNLRDETQNWTEHRTIPGSGETSRTVASGFDAYSFPEGRAATPPPTGSGGCWGWRSETRRSGTCPPSSLRLAEPGNRTRYEATNRRRTRSGRTASSLEEEDELKLKNWQLATNS